MSGKPAVNGNGNGRWAKIGAGVAVVMLCFTLFGSIGYMTWWLFGLSSDLKNMTTNHAGFEKRVQDQITVVDGKADTLTETNASTVLRIRTVERDLNEIETQFCANDQIRNTNLSHVERMIAMLWQKEYGQPYPVSTYFPMVCNRKPDK